MLPRDGREPDQLQAVIRCCGAVRVRSSLPAVIMVTGFGNKRLQPVIAHPLQLGYGFGAPAEGTRKVHHAFSSAEELVSQQPVYRRVGM